MPILNLKPHPFKQQRFQFEIAPGVTLSQLLPKDRAHVRAYVNGGAFPDDKALSEDDVLDIAIIPLGETRQETGQKALNAGLTILSTVAVTLATGGNFVAGLKAGSVIAGLQLIGGAIAPNPSLGNRSRSNTDFSRLGALTGSKNQLRPYSVVPRIYGKRRIYPVMSAQPHTEIVANQQFIRLLFNVGYGPLRLTDPKIGDTVIGSFNENNVFTSNNAFDDIEVEVKESPDLYSRDVNEASVGVDMSENSDVAIRSTAADTNEFSVDFLFPSGLFAIDGDDIVPNYVHFLIEHRVTPVNFTADAGTDRIQIAGHIFQDDDTVTLSTDDTLPGGLSDATTYHVINATADDFQLSTTQGGSAVNITDSGSGNHTITGDWIKTLDSGEITVTHEVRGDRTIPSGESDTVFVPTSSAKETYRAGISIKPRMKGQYDVRVTRTGSRESKNPISGGQYFDEASWSTLRSVNYQKPTNLPGTVQVAIKLKATDQLSGVVDNFSVVAESRLGFYDGSSWDETAFDADTGNGTGGKYTSNPAWIIADILSGSANSGALSRSRIDEDAFKTWADNCDTEGRECNIIVDSGITVHDLIKEVASYGYADVNIVDGVYTVVEDKDMTTPVQHLTPRNSMSFSATRVFPDIPHAIKVRFINPAKEWQQDEAIVYDDGYNADGSGGDTRATKFETVDFLGITSWNQAWKTGRYMIAEQRLRPEIYTMEVDFEHLIANRGDLVKVTHDVPLWGLGYGRVKSVTRNGTNEVTDITLDSNVAMESGNDYVIRVRGDDGASHELTVTTAAGEFSSISVTPEVADIAAGDLFMFGELGSESVNLKITQIEAKNDLEARLTLVDDAPEIYDADTGTIPDFDSQMTTPIDLENLKPAAPTLDSIRSDNNSLYKDDDGSYRLRLLVSFSIAGGNPSLQVEARYRRTDTEDGWSALSVADANLGVVSLENVERGKEYTIAIRSRYRNQTSDWVYSSGHTVTGKNEAPKDVTGFTVSVDKSQMRLRWDDNGETDIDYYEIRKGGTGWDDATLIDRTKTKQATDEITTSGTYTYRIKARDTAGNYSANAVTDSETVEVKYAEDPAYPGDDSFLDRDGGNATLPDLRNNIGVEIGSDVQAHSDYLDDIAGLTPSNGAIIVGDGSGFVAETGATARASLGADDASNLIAGTLPSARLSGSYTGITGVGALDAGSITDGFGSIDIGSSSLSAGGVINFGTTNYNYGKYGSFVSSSGVGFSDGYIEFLENLSGEANFILGTNAIRLSGNGPRTAIKDGDAVEFQVGVANGLLFRHSSGLTSGDEITWTDLLDIDLSGNATFTGDIDINSNIELNADGSSTFGAELTLDKRGTRAFTFETSGRFITADTDVASAVTFRNLSESTDILSLVGNSTGNLIQAHSDIELTAGNIETDNFSDWFSGTPAGWQATYAGVGDFRTLYIDELFAKSFTVDVAQALAGSDFLTKSVSTLAENFDVPAVSSSTTITVDDLEGLPDLQVFEANDWVRFRVVNTLSGGLNIFNVWGQVTSYSDNGDDTQDWTFTTRSVDSGAVGQTIYKGAIVLDYGTSGDHFIERSVLDRSGGTDFTKVPYDRIIKWTNAASGSPDPDDGDTVYTVVNQAGNLANLTATYSNVSGFGYFSDNAFFTGDLLVGDLDKASDYLEFSSGALTANLSALTADAGTVYIDTETSNGKIALGASASTLTVANTNAGTVINGDGEFKSYIDANNYIRQDGTSLAIKSTDYELDALNLLLTSANGGELEVGTVLTAYGDSNSGTFAGFDFDGDTISSGDFVIDSSVPSLVLNDSGTTALSLNTDSYTTESYISNLTSEFVLIYDDGLPVDSTSNALIVEFSGNPGTLNFTQNRHMKMTAMNFWLNSSSDTCDVILTYQQRVTGGTWGEFQEVKVIDQQVIGTSNAKYDFDIDLETYTDPDYDEYRVLINVNPNGANQNWTFSTIHAQEVIHQSYINKTNVDVSKLRTRGSVEVLNAFNPSTKSILRLDKDAINGVLRYRVLLDLYVDGEFIQQETLSTYTP